MRRYVAPLLLFSGVAVLGYAGFQYGAMLFAQRHLQALWREQQKGERAAGVRTPIALRDSDLTRLSIPRLQLSAVIVEGTDMLSLMIGPGHLTGSAQPGEPGNAVISAHRDTFFREIMALNPGDQIVIERDGRTFTYVVEGFRIVRPNDMSVAAPTADNRLTLITCDPANHLGPAPQRLVVISKLLTTEAPPLSVQASKPHSHAPLKRAAIRKTTEQ